MNKMRVLELDVHLVKSKAVFLRVLQTSEHFMQFEMSDLNLRNDCKRQYLSLESSRKLGELELNEAGEVALGSAADGTTGFSNAAAMCTLSHYSVRAPLSGLPVVVN